MAAGFGPAIAAGVAAKVKKAGEKQGNGEAEAESFGEVYGIVLKRDKEAKAKAHSQRGKACGEEPPIFGGFFHEAK